jgi:hypothetical protein
MDDSVKIWAIGCTALVAIAWSIAWGVSSYHQTMAAAGMVQVTIPIGYTTVWAKAGAPLPVHP